MQHFQKVIIFLLIFCSICFVSCRKDEKINTGPDVRLEFSTDTVIFDTVFTSIGSITKKLMVYNTYKEKINISSIRLSGGTSSLYKINIDGSPASVLSNVEIEPHDSIFIFVRVTIDPNNQNNPLVVSDSLIFETNGNIQKVNLVAWGQDAIFLNNHTIEQPTVWTSEKPYVIYGSLEVDTSQTLTIQEGTRVYFHKGSYLVVDHDATLTVNGTLNSPVSFLGDRLDPDYKDVPGQWAGIWLAAGSKGHRFTYAIIRNANTGIEMDSAVSTSQAALTLENTIIQNMLWNGIIAYDSYITAYNLVIANTGQSGLALFKGGNYSFRHMTIGNYWNWSVRTVPSLSISNYHYDNSGNKIPVDLTNAYFGNCIIYGNANEEIETDLIDGAAKNFRFDHCLLQTNLNTSDPLLFSEVIKNEDPLFYKPLEGKMQIDTLSPAIDKGADLGIANDIEGNVRTNAPDLGAYEFTPGGK